MALWGISTNTEGVDNNYAIPKYLMEVDRNNTPYNCFADNRGWIYRRYKTTEHSGLSSTYNDEILVPVVGLNTAGFGSNTTGLGQATPIAVFFEDPNRSSIIAVSAGGTTGIGTNRVGFVHVVWNEMVYCSAGATILISGFTTTGVATGGNIIATAASTGAPVQVNIPGIGQTVILFNGQLTNRVAFAFTSPATGIGTVLRINTAPGVVGVVTDASGGATANKTISGLIKNIAGAGTTSGVGIGATTLTVIA